MNIDEINEFPSEEEIKKRKSHYFYIQNKVLKSWHKEHNRGAKRKGRNEAYAKMYAEMENFWVDENEKKKQMILMRQQIKRCKDRNTYGRGTVTKYKLKQLIMEEARRRAALYEYENDENNKMKKKKILCIVGDSGVGKTLVSLHLKYKLGANVICSFTTRKARPTEVEGRDHHFVDIMPPKDQLLALTMFGQHKYYALKSQVYGPLTVYVVDEDGLVNLIENHSDEYEVYSIYIKRRWSNRLRSGVDELRMRRDSYRTKLDLSFYNYVITNDSTKRELFKSVEDIYNKLKEEE